jgi:methyl-accepting chemotaxis protein
MSISRKIIASIGVALAVAFTATTWVIGNHSATATRDLAYQLATEAASHQGQAIQTELEHAMGVVRALEFYSRESVIQGNTDRALLNQVLARSVKDNPGFLLGSWMLWEPNAYDGRDQEYANTPQHDDTGRVNSYWHWDDSGQVIHENNVEWEEASWYNEPRKAGEPILLDPYIYKVSGVDTMLISLIAPVIIDDRFQGVMGVDFKLSTLQKYVRDIKVLGDSYAALIANDGTYIAHPDSEKIGQKLGDTREEKLSLRSIQSGNATVRVNYDAYLHEEAHTLYTPIKINGALAPWSLRVSIPTRLEKISVRPRNRILKIAIFCSGENEAGTGEGAWIFAALP